MTQPMPYARAAVFALSAATWLASAPALAEKADRNQPMNVEADALRYEDAKQVSVFTGNVLISKGSLVLRANRIEVRQDAQGYQMGVAAGSAGKLAYFKQKREGVDEFMEGEAETIEYDGRADTVKFSKRAVLRRLRGATVADEASGAVIAYDNTTDTFTVDGGGGNAAAGNPGGRVRAVIGPRGVAPPAPASSAPTPVRASTTLGIDKKP